MSAALAGRQKEAYQRSIGRQGRAMERHAVSFGAVLIATGPQVGYHGMTESGRFHVLFLRWSGLWPGNFSRSGRVAMDGGHSGIVAGLPAGCGDPQPAFAVLIEEDLRVAFGGNGARPGDRPLPVGFLPLAYP